MYLHILSSKSKLSIWIKILFTTIYHTKWVGNVRVYVYKCTFTVTANNIAYNWKIVAGCDNDKMHWRNKSHIHIIDIHMYTYVHIYICMIRIWQCNAVIALVLYIFTYICTYVHWQCGTAGCKLLTSIHCYTHTQ